MVLRLTANGYTTIRDMLAEIAKVDEAIVDRLRPSERDVFVGLLRKLI